MALLIPSATSGLAPSVVDPSVAAATPVIVSVSNASAATAAALAGGKYLLWSSVDVWWTIAAAPTAVWETTSYPLSAGQFVLVTLPALKVAGITNGSTGKFVIIPVV